MIPWDRVGVVEVTEEVGKDKKTGSTDVKLISKLFINDSRIIHSP